jgi:ketosteroid isomerase-like protein
MIAHRLALSRHGVFWLMVTLSFVGVGSARLALADSSADVVAKRAQELLSAYSSNDQTAVLAMLDTHDLTVYGSDIAEVVKSRAEFAQLMIDDFALWKTAAFGPMQDVSIRVKGELATAFFDVQFSAGGRPPAWVRFATVWRSVKGRWLLTQSANSVPTVGSSAADLVRPSSK